MKRGMPAEEDCVSIIGIFRIPTNHWSMYFVLFPFGFGRSFSVLSLDAPPEGSRFVEKPLP